MLISISSWFSHFCASASRCLPFWPSCSAAAQSLPGFAPRPTVAWRALPLQPLLCRCQHDADPLPRVPRLPGPIAARPCADTRLL
jgi:hypothetical protein